MIKTKLCGFKNKETIAEAIKQKVGFIGFIFAKKSIRYIEPKKAAEISSDINQNIAKVAVLSDNNINEIKEIINYLKPQYLQFHGNEDFNFIAEIKNLFPEINIIKTIKVLEKSDLFEAEKYQDLADMILFDSKIKSEDNIFGGSGKKFDWQILADFNQESIFRDRWFLSGGINQDNLSEAVKITKTKYLDISSAIEEVRGEKSKILISQIMTKINNLC
jgi:phosphoribosylanthranilate isomerase